MNVAITEGVALMPPAFSSDLTIWSREDGTVGSATYNGAVDAAFVPADQDFGGCLELQKTDVTQRLRWMGQTPILPGTYLRVRAKVKAMSGAFPTVRIAGWAGGAGDAHVAGLTEVGSETVLDTYGEIVEVSAIIGVGARTGVDMVWGSAALYGHFGIDLTGASGGVIRVDDIVIEDITEAFLRTMMDWVDVIDFGAIGDGVADDAAAFEAADAAADGRDVLVPAGTYFLGSDVTFENRVRFEGTVVMDAATKLICQKEFGLPVYLDAFGDEGVAFQKAFQALLNFSDHESLDLGGRRIEVDAPLDLASFVPGQETWEVRRVIRNGQFNVVPGSAWDGQIEVSQASYDAGDPLRLTSVVNVANVPVGSRVSGNGVGREVYVTAKNVGAGTIDLSQPLFGAAASQNYTFTRYAYVLDFSGFTKLSKFTLTDVEIHCQGEASGILLAPAGETFHLKDSFVTKPKDRAVTSIGSGCQDLQIDRCHFVSDEQDVAATARVSVALNVNANDAKIRDNRFQRFGTTMVLNGNGHLIVGNHWFQGDNVVDGPRLPGLVLTETNVKSVLTGNYIDNAFIEWTNEHDATPDFAAEYSFGGLTVTGNIFTVNDAASYFSWIVVKPFGTGHFLHGLSVTGNTFKSLNGTTDRVEQVDDSYAALDFSLTRNVEFAGNTFNGIGQNTINPVTVVHDEGGQAANWTVDVSGYLPFGGWAREVTALVAEGPVAGANGVVTGMPYAMPLEGASKNQVRVVWPEAATGRVLVTARVDRPI